MRACLLLVCYLGAVSALPKLGSVPTTTAIGQLRISVEQTMEACGNEARQQYLQCTGTGTSKLECEYKVSKQLIQCLVDPAPPNHLSRAASPLGGPGDTIKCLIHVAKDLATCIIYGEDEDEDEPTSIWGKIAKCLAAEIAEALLCFKSE